MLPWGVPQPASGLFQQEQLFSEKPHRRQSILARCWTAAPRVSSATQSASGGTTSPCPISHPCRVPPPPQLLLPLAGQNYTTITLQKSVRCYL